jgi:hypothetical protein
MPLLSEMELPCPKNWQEFETLCLALWKEIWNDPNAQKNGRSGNPQKGVDIFGQPKSGSHFHGVQCKGRDNFTNQKVTGSELRKEIEKAERFKPAITHFVLATTAARDFQLQEAARKISQQRQTENLFSVAVFAWDDIHAELSQRTELCEKLYPQLFRNATASDRETIRQYYQALDRFAFRVAMHHEEPNEFFKAMHDTRISLTTGVIRLSDGQIVIKVKGKSLLGDEAARNAFDGVVDLLRQIEMMWKDGIRKGLVVRECICHDEPLLRFMDDTRNELIEIANGVFVRYGLAPLPSIMIPIQRGLGNTTAHLSQWHLLSHRYEGEPPREPVKVETLSLTVLPHDRNPIDPIKTLQVDLSPRRIEQTSYIPPSKLDGDDAGGER